jgi:hypothetical protein
MNALLIIGSPKGKAGTSYAIGGSLLRRLAAAGWETGETTVAAALSSPEKQEAFGRAVAAADLVLYSFPLYVDQLPAPVILSLPLLAEQASGRRLGVIVQCGFPETHQNAPAVDIMRKFAIESGFHWAGALAAGMGGAVGNRSLDKPSGPVRNMGKALDLAAASLASGGDIPEEASALFGKPMMPKFLYTLAANFGMKMLARKHKVKKRVYDRPYA